VQIITLCTLHFAFGGVHYSDEISNRQFIIDFAKVVDFIVEMEALHPPLSQTALSYRHFGLF